MSFDKKKENQQKKKLKKDVIAKEEVPRSFDQQHLVDSACRRQFDVVNFNYQCQLKQLLR